MLNNMVTDHDAMTAMMKLCDREVELLQGGAATGWSCYKVDIDKVRMITMCKVPL